MNSKNAACPFHVSQCTIEEEGTLGYLISWRTRHINSSDPDMDTGQQVTPKNPRSQ